MKEHGLKTLGALVIATFATLPQFASAATRSTPTDQVSTIARLEEAESADRLNANSFTSENPTLDHFYDGKADEVKFLLERLRAGDYVAPKDIDRALDNSEAQTL